MHNIITEILVEMGFSIQELNSGYFTSKSNKATYYILDFNELNDETNIRESVVSKQNSYYSNIMEMKDNKVILKNTSLLIFIQVKDKEQADYLKETIIEFEEDKYFFRKYVLVYTENELESLRKRLPQNGILNYINNEIKNTECFDKFKKRNNIDHYNLLLKMLIKIPVLNFYMGLKENMPSLESMIENELKEKQLMDLNKRVREFRDKELKKISDHDIDDFIESILNI
ncbi:MAG: hypothetical protein K0S61_309 [Anaerocolumna sp.]|jgi:hypothetical protein|nr:hypothetical protein [Anaerocolumna sp.]